MVGGRALPWLAAVFLVSFAVPAEAEEPRVEVFLHETGCDIVEVLALGDLLVTGGTIRVWVDGDLVVDVMVPYGFTRGTYDVPPGSSYHVEIVLTLADGSTLQEETDELLRVVDDLCPVVLVEVDDVALTECEAGSMQADGRGWWAPGFPWMHHTTWELVDTSWTITPALPGSATGLTTLAWPAGAEVGIYHVLVNATFSASNAYHVETYEWSEDTATITVWPCGTVLTPEGSAAPALRRSAPSNHDTDGDGVIDAHDNCPMVANPASQGGAIDCALVGEEDEVPQVQVIDGLWIDGCLASLPQQVRADRFPDDGVRVRWTWDATCPAQCPQDGSCRDVRFAVWNDTAGSELVAVVPYDPQGAYEVWDLDAWTGSHRYEVQLLFRPGAPVHELQAIMPTNLVPACFCTGGLDAGGDPGDAGQGGDTSDPVDRGDARDEIDGRGSVPQDSDASRDIPVGPAPWLVVGLAALARRLQMRPPG